jgi:flagellar export protein FliJ
MNAFRFPLEKVLAWRRTQLEIEQAEFRRRAAAVADIDHRRAELDAAAVRAETQVREWKTLDGRDLQALGRFRQSLHEREKRLVEERAQCEQRLGEQRGAMLEARRRCRLLERLRERRQAEWSEAAAREIETFAADAYLAKWPARRARGG